MQILVTYDVSTTTAAGRRRLRRVARVCEDFGQRVQKSVFECTLGTKEYFTMRSRLLDEMDPEEDNLRLYRFSGSFSELVECYGVDRRVDFEGPLIA